ncbi:hypothetical protein BCY86_02870 [Pajaroellobacter abortibovis]|uniref:Uncharacterized protein n=1 Tax=Pajaroellobacter abortibovis TaxID=1882918 RepID=A0A1L6MW07_9BACT|nr:hypothetical protein BCY86_02870 [Pajaroellobacter abortibovis]
MGGGESSSDNDIGEGFEANEVANQVTSLSREYISSLVKTGSKEYQDLRKMVIERLIGKSERNREFIKPYF